MDRLGVLLREAFVELHSPPLMHQLLAQFQKSYPKLDFPEPPSQGPEEEPLDLNAVLKSEYFFN